MGPSSFPLLGVGREGWGVIAEQCNPHREKGANGSFEKDRGGGDVMADDSPNRTT